LDKRKGADLLSLELQEDVPLPSLTDVLQRLFRKTLEKNRLMLNTNQDIRSVTITVRLTELGRPYKVLLLPSHESDGE